MTHTQTVHLSITSGSANLGTDTYAFTMPGTAAEAKAKRIRELLVAGQHWTAIPDGIEVVTTTRSYTEVRRITWTDNPDGAMT